jgi:hypothetical protein
MLWSIHAMVFKTSGEKMRLLRKIHDMLFAEYAPMRIKPNVALVPVTAKRISRTRSRHIPYL